MAIGRVFSVVIDHVYVGGGPLFLVFHHFPFCENGNALWELLLKNTIVECCLLTEGCVHKLNLARALHWWICIPEATTKTRNVNFLQTIIR